MNATWTKLDRILDEIQDPEAGLALLAKLPTGEETPEQAHKRTFWQFQFTQWQGWRAGDLLAVPHALTGCSILNRPPPRWLCEASLELFKRSLSDDEKRAYGDLNKHFLRWKAVEQVRGRLLGDPRYHKKPVHGDTVWREAAKLVAGKGIKRGTTTMKKSHSLIKRAGGGVVTLPSYRRAVEKRDRGRKKVG
jgi:hypothetical protein